MKTESTPPKDPPTPPSAMAKAASTSPTTGTTALGEDGPRAKKAGVGPVRTRAAPSKTFVCRGFGDCSMVFSRSEHLARHVRKHTGERPFACHCGKQFSRLDNLRQHAQTVHSDKADLNERMMRDLTSLHTALAASSHRSLPRLSPSQPTASQGSRSQPSTPNDSHPPSAGVVPSMAYESWRRDDFSQESFLSGQPFRPDQSFRGHLAIPPAFPPSHSSYAPLSDHRFQPAANDFHPHPSGRDSIGRFPSSNPAHPNGSFERSHPGRDGYDRSPLERLDFPDRSVDDGGGTKPFTSGGSAGGGLPPISSLIPREQHAQPLFPPSSSRPATAGSVSGWRTPTGPLGRPATSAGSWLPPLDGRPGLSARPATAAAPLGFGPSAPSSRPGTSGGLGPLDRGGDVFAFEPPALASSRYDDGDDDRSSRDRDGDGPRSFGLPFGLRPGTAPAASFDRAGRGREWERERAWYGRDQSSERGSRRGEFGRDDGDQRGYHGSRRPAHDGWDRDRLASSRHSSPSPESPDPSLERRRESGGLYPGDSDREVGLLSPNGGGYDSPFSYHPPGLAPRKRSYDFGPGDAPGPDSRPSSRRLTLMELCSESAPDDHAAGTPFGVSTHGKSPVERGREPPPLVRPATVSGGDSSGLPGIASFSYRAGPDTIHERAGSLSLGPAAAASKTGTEVRDTDGRGDSLPPPPSPPPTAVGRRDDDGERERQRERLFERRDPAHGSSDSESDGLQRGTGLSDSVVGASSAASHWRERERRGQVRTPISPPLTATGVRAGSAS